MKALKIYIAIHLLLSFTTNACYAAPEKIEGALPKVNAGITIETETLKTEIQTCLHDYYVNRKPSGTILVSVENSIIETQSFGYADKNLNIKNLTNTQYLIGSITKQFTAAALLRALYDKALSGGLTDNNASALEKKLGKYLQEPISHYLPANHTIWSGDMPKWATTITVHQLLTHTSGIPNFTSLPEYQNSIEKPLEVSGVVNYFKDKSLDFEPGSRYSYSNSGYLLLGEIVQQITGEPLNVYMHSVFFKPLDMTSTIFVTTGTVNDLKKSGQDFNNLARAYKFDIVAEHPVPVEFEKYEQMQMQMPRGAGSLISSAPDLLKWNNSLYAGKVIPNFLLKIMLTPYISKDDKNKYYGYGIVINESERLSIYYSHNGSIPGYRSNLVYIPSLKLTIICLTNLVASEDKLEQEIKEIENKLATGLSNKERNAKIDAELIKKYPVYSRNEELYNTRGIVDYFIKRLEVGH